MTIEPRTHDAWALGRLGAARPIRFLKPYRSFLISLSECGRNAGVIVEQLLMTILDQGN